MIAIYFLLALHPQPQLAASGDQVALVSGSATGIEVQLSKDGGQKFTKAGEIAVTGKMMLGRHRGPRVAITNSGIAVSAIVDGELLAWRSQDSGKTWSKSIRINDVERASREGLHAMTANNGLLFVTWLDLRTEGMKLYGAVSKDGGASWSSNQLVYQSPDGAICTCCHPSTAIDHKGRITVMFRNALAGNRDMYWVRSADEGRTWSKPILFGTQHWEINACPMDGGGFSLDANGMPVGAWRQEKTVYFEGKAIGNGKDPAIAGQTVVWTSPEGLRTVDRVLDPSGEYPSVILTRSGVIAAWESKDTVRVEKLR